MAKQQIGILGWYGHENAGDESYKLSFPKMFPQYDCVFVEDTKDKLPVYILGGGDVVGDHFLQILKDIPKKHIISAAISKEMTNLTGFSTIAVRDMQSVANAATSGVVAQYAPDFAFALNFSKERGKELIKKQFAKRDLYNKVIAVVVNAHLLPEHGARGVSRETVAFDHLAYQLSQAIDNTSASFIFIPFGTEMPWDDRTSNSWVASRCKFHQKNTVVYDRLSAQDTIDIVSACDAVISTRLHSSIFACVAGVPFLDITHNHKNKGFLDTVGMIKLSVSYSAVNYDFLLEKLRGFLSDNVELKDELLKIANQQKAILKEFAQKVKIL
jgi:polysaccharide pyruvyl transferase WcaK-like protein